MREEIALLFAPQQSRPGWSAAPTDFRRATTIKKGHGRLEKRTITVSSLLAGYSTFPNWPRSSRWKAGCSSREVAPGVR